MKLGLALKIFEIEAWSSTHIITSEYNSSLPAQKPSGKLQSHIIRNHQLCLRIALIVEKDLRQINYRLSQRRSLKNAKSISEGKSH